MNSDKNENFVQVTKEEYVLNVIGLGYAIEILSGCSKMPKELWALEIATHANDVLEGMPKEIIDAIVTKHAASYQPYEIFSSSTVDEINNAENN
ncbi:hypothetical protein [Nostoc sp.]|uniref:hypothetical protein n=1 Tax=Nostoc sp. TaxID=1180 RepID=UPI002FF4E175